MFSDTGDPYPEPTMTLRDRYVDLLFSTLTRSAFLDEEVHDVRLDEWEGLASLATDANAMKEVLRQTGSRLTRQGGDASLRQVGHDWPPTAETMVGVDRLNDVRSCVAQVLDDGIPGDFIETGVWRGGVTILMKGMLEAWGDTDRTVWVADSFEGLPPPDTDNYPADAGMDWSTVTPLKVSAEQVRANFERYGLLDDRVKFLQGWFSDTLATAPIDQLAILRLDGDLYESTMDALTALEPKVADGGYVLVDDYGGWEACRKAVDHYRGEHGITSPIEEVDWTGVHWRVER